MSGLPPELERMIAPAKRAAEAEVAGALLASVEAEAAVFESRYARLCALKHRMEPQTLAAMLDLEQQVRVLRRELARLRSRAARLTAS